MLAVLTLSLPLSCVGFAQTNVQQNQDAQTQLKQDHKADKAQAKADKHEQKALRTKEAKRAAKAQDKADRQADKAAAPAR
ncbi:MAG: hypothetical protein M3Y50_16895 [Acidobacteriota bacterium]|nr:hypothetical protein [Acidobacteriota bacterium]